MCSVCGACEGRFLIIAREIIMHVTPLLTRAQVEAAEAQARVNLAKQRLRMHECQSQQEKRIVIPPRQLKRSASETDYEDRLIRDGDGRTFLSHLRAPWTERIEWYRGSTRAERPYSRRELAADYIVHAIGLVLACAGCVAISERLYVRRPPPIMVLSVCLYAFGLVSCLLCSMAFNVGQAYLFRHRWALRSADHAGICLLIAGTYSPTMAVACTNRTLIFVWTIGLLSTLIKWTRWPSVDRLPIHVAAFLLMGWSCTFIWGHVQHAFSEWATQLFLVGGALYTVGLIPWAGMKWLEFHIAIWHLCVVAASACFYAVVYIEILGMDHPDCGWKEALEESVSAAVKLVYNATVPQDQVATSGI